MNTTKNVVSQKVGYGQHSNAIICPGNLFQSARGLKRNQCQVDDKSSGYFGSIFHCHAYII